MQEKLAICRQREGQHQKCAGWHPTPGLSASGTVRKVSVVYNDPICATLFGRRVRTRKEPTEAKRQEGESGVLAGREGGQQMWSLQILRQGSDITGPPF